VPAAALRRLAVALACLALAGVCAGNAAADPVIAAALVEGDDPKPAQQVLGSFGLAPAELEPGVGGSNAAPPCLHWPRSVCEDAIGSAG
jgi:hypothetical protein